jgi:hypothetical protein
MFEHVADCQNCDLQPPAASRVASVKCYYNTSTSNLNKLNLILTPDT